MSSLYTVIEVIPAFQRKLKALASVHRQARDAFTLAGCYFWSGGEHPVEAGI